MLYFSIVNFKVYILISMESATLTNFSKTNQIKANYLLSSFKG